MVGRPVQSTIHRRLRATPGRLYRALYAWNRTLDPRVALLPGTRLDIPPVERLTAAWPGLVPTRP